MQNENKNQTISWQAPEFKHYEKNPGWFIALGCISVLVAGFFIFQGDVFAAVTCLLLGGFIYYFAKQTPRIVTIELTNKNIRYGNVVYPYQQIKYFWVVLTEHHKTLNLQSTAYVNNIIIIELEDQDPDTIRSFLLQYLPEHHETEPTLTQKVSHKLKF